MSYCVNCGVKLAESEKSCPLCGVEVINPRVPTADNHRRNYPDTPVSGYKDHYRDLVLPLALLMLIPVFITMSCDWLLTGTLSWSLYVLSSIVLICVFILPPLAFKRPKVLLCLSMDWICITAYLYLLEQLTETSWFIVIGLPLSIIAGVITMGVALLFLKANLTKLVKTAVVLFSIGLITVCIDLFINMGVGYDRIVSWSLYPLVPCVILGFISLLINRNHNLKEKVKQRFFI